MMNKLTTSIEQLFWASITIFLYGVETIMALCSGRFRYAWNNILSFPGFAWMLVSEWWLTTICG
jgi:hypothetical protein